MLRLRHALRCAALLLVAVVPAVGRADVDFNRDVQPILSGHCYKCHGPDEASRDGGVRLDVRDSAIAEADSGEVPIVPGQPEASEFVRRIFADDEGERMPPPEANKPLSDEQKQVLRQWIAEGAPYDAHWAFVPPVQAPLPAVEQAEWPRNPIDYFILARLEAAGLAPSPEADRHTLARRVYLDLIGLPPTAEELAEFVDDPSPDAYELLVDRLLASPHYGERWARRWLDLARYADTNGYEKDRVRSMWPYRDWVIRALNDDMPFDQFTIEQLAGDMLPEATIEQRIATGFHRNTMINEEGGIDPLEYRFHAMIDRVNTTGTVWLGLTVGCAQCHTHKYDPLPQTDYYRLMAYLNNADELVLSVPEDRIAAERTEIERAIARLEAGLADRFPPEGENRSDDAELVEATSAPGAETGSLDEALDDDRPLEVRRAEHLERRFAEWLDAQRERTIEWTSLEPVEAASEVPTLTILDDGSVLASGDQTKRDVYSIRYGNHLDGITAIRLEVLPDESLPNRGPGRVAYEGPFGDFFLSELSLAVSQEPAKLVDATHSFANGGNTAAAAIDGDPHTGWSINGGQGRSHTAVFHLAEPLAAADVVELQMVFEKYYAAGLGRFRLWATTDSNVPPASDLPTEIEPLLLAPTEMLTDAGRQPLLQHFLLTAPELSAAREEIDALRKQMPQFPTTLVMVERPETNPRTTHVHHRGEFLQPTDAVEPGLPELLAHLTDDVPTDRLSFAHWLASPANPLVGRVTVNRHWAAFFGRGLVRTTEDFGYQGERPTHPELLDWLAVEWIERGWSIKALHRLIVTSATYRQSSNVTEEHLEKDPENRLLAWAPRVRLDAELIRDAALRSSGLLSAKMLGASVFPPQPPGVSSEGAYGPLAWNVSEGEDRYRRGLYTFAKRTAPYAMFSTFDAPSGEACLPRREVSNTPLQSLTLLNDEVFVEASRALGRQLTECDCVDQGVETLLLRCAGRRPTDAERELVAAFFHQQRERLTGGELDAAVVCGVEGKSAKPSVEQAAWTLTARAILNLDEVVTRP